MGCAAGKTVDPAPKQDEKQANPDQKKEDKPADAKTEEGTESVMKKPKDAAPAASSETGSEPKEKEGSKEAEAKDKEKAENEKPELSKSKSKSQQGTKKKKRRTKTGEKTANGEKVRNTSNRGMLNALALQFSNINKSFQAVYKAFDEYHTGGEGIKEEVTLDKLASCLNAVVDESFSEEDCKELFNLADLDGSKTLQFREFLITVAMGYYLKARPEGTEPQTDLFKQTQKGFKVVEKAFNDMDTDKGGSIDTDELKAALFATSTTENQNVLEARFKELDFDGDGDILLPEFLYGMVSWVGFADEMEEAAKAKKC